MLTGSDLVFTFNRADSSETSDVVVTVEVGSTLDAFPTNYIIGTNTGTSSPGVTVAENDGAPDTITVTVPKGTDARKFARLNVTVVPLKSSSPLKPGAGCLSSIGPSGAIT